MPIKAKITAEIPAYLQQWIDSHDIGQNALITLGLRNLWLQEQQVPTAKIEEVIKETLIKNKLPF